MMKPKVIGLLLAAVVLTACASGAPLSGNGSVVATDSSIPEAILFVELEDGSVVRQTIQSSADYCFKTSQSSETTCFTEGQPIVDPQTQEIIAYRMQEDHLHLVAKH
ncbi:MAG: hypothetical protein AAF385_13635 [Pseudomonadota bacterium]